MQRESNDGKIGEARIRLLGYRFLRFWAVDRHLCKSMSTAKHKISGRALRESAQLIVDGGISVCAPVPRRPMVPAPRRTGHPLLQSETPEESAQKIKFVFCCQSRNNPKEKASGRLPSLAQGGQLPPRDLAAQPAHIE